jgi:hypothetical protein
VQIQILSRPNRPDIQDLKLTWLDVVCEVAALLLLVINWATALLRYTSVPENILDKADAFLFPVLAAMIYFLMLGTNFVSPRLFNYPVEITPSNARTQYTLARQMLSVMKVLVMALFLWEMVTATLIVMGAAIAIFFYRAKRAQ